MAESKPYNYEHLEKFYKDLAVKELKEEPQKIHAHIESLRIWLHQSKHIQNCPDDDYFLLKFLRAAKFNHENAQHRLEVFCTLRGSKLHGSPSFFEFPSLEDKNLRLILDWGLHVPCGYNDRGEQVIIGNMKNWDPDLVPYEDLVPYNFMALEINLADERTQIAGLAIIYDFHGFSQKDFNSIMHNTTALKNWTKNWQEGLPMRNGSLYIYREPVIFDVIYKLVSFWMKEKLRKRFHRCGNDLMKIHAMMPGAKRILPREYGGENGTFAELKAKYASDFFEFWRQPRASKKIAIDESLQSTDFSKLLKHYDDYPAEAIGAEGSYTKMDVL